MNRGARITLNDPDYVFYLPVAEQAALRDEPALGGTRQLTSEDENAFVRFAGEAPEADIDEAFVELDHWLVFGTFVDGRLVAAASMYPWEGTRLADLGVITLPDYRGRGLGGATVRAISAHAIAMGYEPQYRCQRDNAPSVALATSAGFTRFGEWEVIVRTGKTP
ncbi:GNAT superfamily N-acetyltransferase [Marisediminicola sp. UYEF4]